MEKVIRDWKVAIVISPRFGAWWYTWNTKYAELLFHPKIVEMVEQWKGNEMTQEWIIDNIWIWVNDDDEWELIEEEPKQGDEIKFGDMVYVRYKWDENFLEIPRTYLWFKDWYHWALDSWHTLENWRWITPWDEVKKAPNKIELTIEEIEEKLGYEKGSLSIK